jgi:hypothetical protein
MPRLLAAALAVGLATGCTIYTVREYGPQERSTVIAGQSSFSEVVKNLGSPDAIHATGPGTVIWVFHSLNYRNYLSLYAETRKDDLVLTFVGDKLADNRWVSRGQTMAIIAGQSHSLGVNVGD